MAETQESLLQMTVRDAALISNDVNNDDVLQNIWWCFKRCYSEKAKALGTSTLFTIFEAEYPGNNTFTIQVCLVQTDIQDNRAVEEPSECVSEVGKRCQETFHKISKE